MFKKIFITIAFLILISIPIVGFAQVNVGENYAANIGLGAKNPREIAAKVVNISLGFLSIVAVFIILYGGYLWMTSQGEQDKVEKAKKVLTSAVIGLIIILSAWTIAWFVISKMLQSTNTNPPGSSDGSGPSNKAPNGAFIITDISPRNGAKNVIRNVVIRIYFNHNIDSSTVNSNTIKISENGSPLDLGNSESDNYTVKNNIVEFKPETECPLDSCATGQRCFNPNKNIQVNVSTGVKDTNGNNLYEEFNSNFSTSNVIDCGPPSIKISNVSPQICLGYENIIKAKANDESGIAHIMFSDSQDNSAFNSVLFPCFLNDCKNFTATTTWTPNNDKGYIAGQKYTLTVIAQDLDDHSANDSLSMTLRPAHCCNGIKDSDEQGIDCGGKDCAGCSGAACGINLSASCSKENPEENCSNDNCASYFCNCGDYPNSSDSETCKEKGYSITNGNTCCVCEDKPIIDWFLPNNGAIGTMVTIGGRFFGKTPGAVYFYNGNSYVQAKFPDQVNPKCNSYWKDNQVIVVVPEGAVSGIIRVESANGFSDDSNDDRGPNLNDFTVNNVHRPGICKITPTEGYFKQKISYAGVGFSGDNKRILFGSNKKNKSSLSDRFSLDGLFATGTVPLLAPGLTTSFIKIGDINSNPIYFTNKVSPDTPIVQYFFPKKGPPGQYVTIIGSNFGHFRKNGEVMFGNETANYNFPNECSNSVWTNSQIIVKVPNIDNGNYFLTVRNNNGLSGISNDKFNVDKSISLNPGLCKIEPNNGPVKSQTTLYGEYFEKENSNVIFSIDKLANPSQSNWELHHNESDKADKVSVKVPDSAQSGSVRVLKNVLTSNPMNFTVQYCQSNEQCSDENPICCPADYYHRGSCMSSIDDCGYQIGSDHCQYYWTFSTLNSVGNNSGNDNGKEYSCSGFNTGSECDAAGMCPNSPGMCSTGNITNAGSCDCQQLFKQCSNEDSCFYSSEFNACIKGTKTSSSTCSIYNGDSINGISNFNGYSPFCNKVGDNFYWQIDQGETSCPDSSFLESNGLCTLGTFNNPATCNKCSDGFSCIDDNNGKDNTGVCIAEGGNNICPNDSICNNGECIYNNSKHKICECCCRKEKENEDCCAPLKCEGKCGEDKVSGNNTYGYCSGCRVDTNNDGKITGDEIALSDKACNCFGHTGKYCDVSVDVNGDGKLDGVCRDCTQLTVSGCQSHNSFCCIDAEKGNKCRGGNGTLISDGYCAYYNCKKEPNQDQCDLDNPVIKGDYSATSTCISSCSAGLVGTKCIKKAEPKLKCNTGVENCGTGYSCLEKTNTLSSCRCCCDPNNDKCKDIDTGDPYTQLKCEPNKGPCTGENRGVCCGCISDNNCGDTLRIGCGADSCCYTRPKVATTTPDNKATNVCTNTVIKAEFDRKMDFNSFTGNIIVVGDYGDEICPKGTVYLTYNTNKEKSFAHRIVDLIIRKVSNFFSKIISQKVRAASNHNFCAIQGTVSWLDKEKATELIFSPVELLDPGRTYYVIIKGDSNLADSLAEGVVSKDKVSMADSCANNNDCTFNNKRYYGKVWSFTTATAQGKNPALCRFDKVKIEPNSYLFQTVGHKKEFIAHAIDENGQEIVPMKDVYDWTWQWSSTNEKVASVTNEKDTNGKVKQVQTVTSGNVQDARAKITAISTIKSSPFGDSKRNITGTSTVYVFLCANPWPPLNYFGDPVNWHPYEDRDYNFEMYYCRDNKNKGTADDLPAIEVNPVEKNESTSNNKVCWAGIKKGKKCNNDSDCNKYLDQNGDEQAIACSNGKCNGGEKIGLPCSNDNDCYYGYCAHKQLKELYFFRQKLPNVSAISLSASNKTINSNGKVELKWNNVGVPAGKNLGGYKIYYGINSKYYTSSIDVGNITEKTIENLAIGTKYYFAVTAYWQQGGESNYSNEVNATPIDNTAPTIPTGFKVKDISNGSVSLKWNVNSDDTKGYKLYYKVQGAGSYAQVFDVGDVIEYNINNLTNGVSYDFAISSYDFYNNESEKSNKVSATPLSAPANLTVKTIGDNQVDLSWDKVENSQAYKLYYSDTDDLSKNSKDDIQATSTSITKLTNGTTYYFVVVAKNKQGQETNYSNKVSATPLSAPANLTVKTIGDNQVDLSWDKVENSQAYKLYYSDTDDLSKNSKDDIQATSTSITKLTNGTTYYFVVVAKNKQGQETNYSNKVSATPGG